MARGVELATAYVSLAVSADGIGAQVAKQFAQVDRVAEDTGKRAGKTLSNAFGGSTKMDLSQIRSEVDKTQRAVDTASKTTEAARHRESQAALLVEQRTKELASAVNKYGSDSSQAIAKERALSDAKFKLSGESLKAVAAQEQQKRAQEQLTKSARDLQKAESDAADGSKSLWQKLGSAIRNPFASLSAQARAAGEDAGRQMGSGMQEPLLSGARSAFTRVVGLAGTLGIGLSVGSVIGKTLSSGMDRYINIENSQAKLKALGNSAQDVKLIMDGALSAVKGTAFGLGDAVNVAASAVAAGIKPGAELNKTLQTIANTSAVAGTGMQDVGMVFMQVAAKGKADAGDLQQLADRGIPAMSLLSNALGKPREEVAKMVSKGKIDFKTFQDAMAKGMSPEAAKTMGNTLQGSMDNAKTAMARFGASVMEVFGPSLKIMFDRSSVMFDNLGKKLPGVIQGFKELGSWAAETFGPALKPVFDLAVAAFGELEKKFPAMIQGFKDMGVWISNNKAWLEPLVGVFGAVIAAVMLYKATVFAVELPLKIAAAAQIAWNAAMSLNPIGLVVVAIAALVAGLIYAYTHSETFRNVVTGAWNGIRDAAMVVWTWMSTVLWPGIVGVWNSISGGAQQMGTGVTSTWDKVTDGIRTAWNAITGVFMAGWNWISGVFLAGWNLIETWLVRPFLAYLNFVFQFWATIAGFLMTWVTWFGGVFASAWGVIQIILMVPMRLAQIGMQVVWDGIRTIFTVAWNWVSGVFMGWWRTIEPIMMAVLALVVAGVRFYFNTVIGIYIWLWGWISGTFMGWYRTLSDLINGVMWTVVNFVTKRWDEVRDLFTNLWNWVNTQFRTWWNGFTDLMRGPIDLAKKVIDGILDGIKTSFDTAVKGIGVIWGGIKAAVREPVVISVKVGNALVGGFNTVARWLKIPEAPLIPDVPAFQSGGRIDLPWSAANRDPYLGMTNSGNLFRFEGEEGIVNRSSMQSLDRNHPGAFDYINATGKLPGFAYGGRLVWPTASHALSPNYNGHSGIDIPVPIGTPMMAAKDGTVVYSGWGRGYGNAVFMNFDDGSTGVYGHGTGSTVPVGTHVLAGDVIGLSNTTGRSTGPHVHFEIAPGGRFGVSSNRDTTLAWLGGAAAAGQSASGDGRSIFDPIGMAKGLFNKAMAGLSDIADSPFGNLVKGIPKALMDGLINKVTSLGSALFGSGNPVTGSRHDVAFALMQAGRALGANRQAMKIALMTVAQESDFTPDFSPDENGDLGLFQNRGYRGDGTPNQLNDPMYSLRGFLFGINGTKDGHIRGLYDNPNWMNMPLGAAAQWVQVSAFPSYYDKHAGEAEKLLNEFAYERGTLSATPGVHLVGEKGPELVNFRGGEKVYSNRRTQELLSGSNGVTIENVTLKVAEDVSPSRVAEALAWELGRVL